MTISIFGASAFGQSLHPTSAPSVDERSAPPGKASIAEEINTTFLPTMTEHFVIYSDCPRDKIAAVGKTAESLWAQIDQLLGDISVRPSRASLTIILFGTFGAFQPHASRHGLTTSQSVPGYFDAARKRCVFFDFDDSPIIAEKRRHASVSSTDLDRLGQIAQATVVRHELAHLILAAHGFDSSNDLPPWLYEGLATQFEDPTGLCPYRLADYATMILQKRPISLRDLLADPSRFAPTSKNAQDAYASAWAYIYFLKNKKPADFQLLLKDVFNPNSDSRKLRAHWAVADEKIESQWRQFINGLIENKNKNAHRR